jgi:hypothetical protein
LPQFNVHHGRESCLLVLDSVTTTPQWIRQPKPRDDVHDVYVFVCKFILGRSRASQPLNILAYTFPSTSTFSLCRMPIKTRSWCRLSISRLLRSPTPVPHRHPTGSGAALVDVRLDVVPFPPRSSSPTVAGCRLGGYSAGRDRWDVNRAVGGMSEDHDRCFSTLVLGAFSTGVFQHQCITPH